MRVLSIAAALLAASIASLVTTCVDARARALLATPADSSAQLHAAGLRYLLQSGALPPASSSSHDARAHPSVAFGGDGTCGGTAGL